MTSRIRPDGCLRYWNGRISPQFPKPGRCDVEFIVPPPHKRFFQTISELLSSERFMSWHLSFGDPMVSQRKLFPAALFNSDTRYNCGSSILGSVNIDSKSASLVINANAYFFETVS